MTLQEKIARLFADQINGALHNNFWDFVYDEIEAQLNATKDEPFAIDVDDDDGEISIVFEVFQGETHIRSKGYYIWEPEIFPGMDQDAIKVAQAHIAAFRKLAAELTAVVEESERKLYDALTEPPAERPQEQNKTET